MRLILRSIHKILYSVSFEWGRSGLRWKSCFSMTKHLNASNLHSSFEIRNDRRATFMKQTYGDTKQDAISIVIQK